MFRIISFLLICCSTLVADQPPVRVFSVEQESVNELIGEELVVERLASGFLWVEGPIWSIEESALYFSDIPANKIYRWSESDGVSVFLNQSGYTGETPFLGREPGSNGLALDAMQRIIMCEHGDRRVTRLETDGSKTVIADNYQGSRLNSPNDVILRSTDDIFFTDPPYGLPNSFDDVEKELSFQGVFRVIGGEITLLTDALKAPNGLGFSPDGKIFYVSNSDPENPVWYAFDFDEIDGLTNQRVFADASDWMQGREGLPDGFCLDVNGNLFAAGPGGIYLISPKGKILGLIDFGHPVSNCTWGEDGSVLYITGNDSIYRIHTNTLGMRAGEFSQ